MPDLTIRNAVMAGTPEFIVQNYETLAERAQTRSFGLIEEDVIVLDSTTGLIGRPTVTVDGVEIQCLLNPRLDVGSLVQIDQKLVQTQTWSTESSEGAVQANMASSDAMIAADGIYRVFSREFVGDTRGTEWYANLMAYGVNAQRPITPAVNQTFPNM